MTKIETREQYEWALDRIETLVNDVSEEMPENDPRKMEFCLLSNLVADYSDEHFDLGAPTLQECIKERMFELGLSQKDVAGILGTSQSRISDLISGKCNPTFELARNICRNLGIPPAVVLGL
ncbi:MAG: helix-turn-helix domain-containing protein [Bacteroidales bacterium]|nr:helix-turn-helix domain-containing protein [Candidatus Cryptobacteroides aphodequi]